MSLQDVEARATEQKREGHPAGLAPDSPDQRRKPSSPRTGSVSRRGLLGAAGIGLAGVAAGAAGAHVLDSGHDRPAAEAALGSKTYPFHGAHQAGIITPAQDRLHFAAFDVTTDSRQQLIQLLKDWTLAAARMTQGLGA